MDGDTDGTSVGETLGDAEGPAEGETEGDSDGWTERDGDREGWEDRVGVVDGETDGTSVGAALGVEEGLHSYISVPSVLGSNRQPSWTCVGAGAGGVDAAAVVVGATAEATGSVVVFCGGACCVFVATLGGVRGTILASNPGGMPETSTTVADVVLLLIGAVVLRCNNPPGLPKTIRSGTCGPLWSWNKTPSTTETPVSGRTTTTTTNTSRAVATARIVDADFILIISVPLFKFYSSS